MCILCLQDGDVTLNLAAAAQKLENMVTEQPDEEEVAATPPPAADVAPGDMGTPWTKEVATLDPQEECRGVSTLVGSCHYNSPLTTCNDDRLLV